MWELATLHGDKPYVVYEDERFTYAEVAAQVRSLAAPLADDLRRADAATASRWRCATTRSG